MRELEESRSDLMIENRELRFELEQAQASCIQFRDVLENEHVRSKLLDLEPVFFIIGNASLPFHQDRVEELRNEVLHLRAALKEERPLPVDVVQSLDDSREAIAGLAHSLREQEAMNSALRAECDAYRDSANNASNAVHGAMVAALRAQQAAGVCSSGTESSKVSLL